MRQLRRLRMMHQKTSEAQLHCEFVDGIHTNVGHLSFVFE